MLEAQNVKYLVVHCSDSPDDENIGAREIHALHQSFGWHGCGYHRVIRRDGTVESGRPDYWIGAHVYGHNEESLGVCLIGRKEFTDAQFNALEELLRSWQTDYPKAQILGHCDFVTTTKTCPNFDVARFCTSRRIVSSLT